jgi:hypothetical protein
MPLEDSDHERRRRRTSRDPESDRERRRDSDQYRRRRGHRATDSQGELLPRNGDRSSREHSSSTPRTRRVSRGGSSSQPLSLGSLAQLDTINAKKHGFKQQEYDADYLDEVRAKERRLEKSRRREEREAERARRREERHAERDERQYMETQQDERDAEAERDRLNEEDRERRREEKRQLRRAEKEKQRQLELAQERAAAETRDMQRNAEREKQRQRRRRGATQDYDDDDDYASSPAVHTPHKTEYRLGANYEELHNEYSPRTKYSEKAHSPKRKSRVISGPYLEDQRSDEVYEYRKDKLEGSSQASDYTSTTIWKQKRNKRICE